MSDGRLFVVDGPPRRVGLSADQRRTQRQQGLLAAGRNPATKLPLISCTGETCGDCNHAHRYVISRNVRREKAVWKCDQHQLGESHSASSDIRRSWPACAMFKPRPTDG